MPFELQAHHVTIIMTVFAVVVVPIVVWIWKELQEARTARLLKVFASREEFTTKFGEIERKRDVQHAENQESMRDFLDTIKMEIKGLNQKMDEKIDGVRDEVGEVHRRVDGVWQEIHRPWSGEERRGRGKVPRA